MLPPGIWCWAAGPVLSKQQLITWCQDQNGFDEKVLADLGLFDYAYQFMREHSYSPELFVLYNLEDQPTVLFICTVVFTPVGVKPPDLLPTPVTFKIMRHWVETKNVPLKNLPYLKMRWPDDEPFPPRLWKAFEEAKEKHDKKNEDEKPEKENINKERLEKSTREATSHSESKG
ncbi:hypothetical protein BT96DRAFT_1007798 [Gymnopus androsaceus JB14]|uniref:Uncharacterized protein n=1 Tax=Gymnopus androsaceus JB14 TaxID=1447944 RepID=A0A6A4GGG3_9AGAR|nr:hypothetical protein BT96DRAFT_1007798 [Gymnopus androsaceus JB14]